jgi:hypothetical protein
MKKKKMTHSERGEKIVKDYWLREKKKNLDNALRAYELFMGWPMWSDEDVDSMVSFLT